MDNITYKSHVETTSINDSRCIEQSYIGNNKPYFEFIHGVKIESGNEDDLWKMANTNLQFLNGQKEIIVFEFIKTVPDMYYSPLYLWDNLEEHKLHVAFLDSPATFIKSYKFGHNIGTQSFRTLRKEIKSNSIIDGYEFWQNLY